MDAVNDATSTSNGSIPGSAAAAVNGNMVPPFLGKTYDMVDDPKTNAIVSWSSGNNSFVVWNVPEFSKQLLPKYFKHNNFSSFVRQLNTYGFRKVDPDRWEFANEGFLRGQKHLLKNISRRKPSHLSNHQQQPKVQRTSAGLCVEVGKFGLDVEVEQLKRDKNVLMQELVRLRQQQQATDQQLQTVGQRVQVMEQRQQQMMSFLAKAMQSPGFLAQLVPQKSEGNRRIGAGNKKRRLPRQDDEGLSSDLAPAAFDGQIVKYQPSMNEAAISMLRQIMKINSTPRYENSRSKSNTFLIDDIPSSNALDSGNLSSRLTTNKVSQAEFPVSCPSDAISGTQTQTSPVVATEHGKANQFPEMSMQNSSENSALPDIPLPLGIVSSENDSRAPNLSFIGPENGKADVLRDGSLPMEANTCSPGPEMNNLMEGIPKLPSISDVFWEQFLTSIPLTEDTDEISSSCLDDSVLGDQFMELQQEDEWDRTRHMDHLTDQMGLLTSGNRRA